MRILSYELEPKGKEGNSQLDHSKDKKLVNPHYELLCTGWSKAYGITHSYTI